MAPRWAVLLLGVERQDPVDNFEVRTQRQIQKIQGNRNPFVDSPHWAESIFLVVLGRFPDRITTLTGRASACWPCNPLSITSLFCNLLGTFNACCFLLLYRCSLVPFRMKYFQKAILATMHRSTSGPVVTWGILWKGNKYAPLSPRSARHSAFKVGLSTCICSPFLELRMFSVVVSWIQSLNYPFWCNRNQCFFPREEYYTPPATKNFRSRQGCVDIHQ